MFDEMTQEIPQLILHQGLPTADLMEEWSNGKHFILVLDDLQQKVQRDMEAAELFTVGSHHKTCTLIYLCHNIFGKGPFARVINLNTHYIILFRNNRDVEQVQKLGRQIFGRNSNFFMDAYDKATSEDWGYLLVNIHPKYRKELLTHILPGEDTIVYKPKK